MSSAPIWMGSAKLPNPDCGAVVKTMKTMIDPCMVISARYCSGVIWPPGVNGILALGQTRWMRISMDRAMPTNTEKSARK